MFIQLLLTTKRKQFMDIGVNMDHIALAVVRHLPQNTKQEHALIQLPSIMDIIAPMTGLLIHTLLLAVSFYFLDKSLILNIVIESDFFE